MTRKCTIAGCPSRSGSTQHRGVTFHVFPLDKKIREVWLKNCRVSSDKNITKSVLVCSRHFRRIDFLPVKSSNKYLLKQGAVPTIFPWGKIDIPNNIKEEQSTDNSSNTNVVGSENSSKTEVEKKITEKEKKSQSRNKRAADKITKANPSKIPKISTENSLGKSSVCNADETSSNKSLLNNSDITNKKVELSPSGFVVGVKIEAQDFNGSWHPAKIIEVDSDEREVLIKFEKSKKNKGGGSEQWIPMNSSRLRQTIPQNIKKPSSTFEVNEKCMARWSGPRRFPATITKIVGNDVYEVLFDDGYVKVVKGHHIYKLKEKQSLNSEEPSSKSKTSNKSEKSDWPLISISSLNLEELNLPDIPQDGEWCCHWVNDQPIGKEGFLMVGDHKKPTVIVEDWRLPASWVKHMYQRSNVLGKWDVILVNPQGKRFRSKADLKQYLEELGQVYNPDIYDFSIHRRRAKDIGAYVYTKNYKPPPPPKPSSQQFPTEISNITLPISILSPSLSENLSSISNENKTPTKSVEQKAELIDDGYVYIGSLKIQIIDNLFRCPQDGCNKNFRKENHLQIHVKHYHQDLAKHLGECPNMQELAYKRTIGTSDEPLPKNHVPNVQFFAKLYQQDIATKNIKKPNSTTPTKSTFSSPSEVGNHISDDTLNDFNKSGNIQEGPSNQIEETENLSTPTSKKKLSYDQLGSTSGNVTPLSSPLQNQKQSPLLKTKKGNTIENFSTESNKGRKSKRQKISKKYVSSKITSCNLLDTSLEVSDQEETRHSFNINVSHTETIKQPILSLKKIKPEPLLLVAEANLDGTSQSQTTGSIQENSQSPNYINENGEIIKIVRMRQEEIINCLCSYTEEDGLMIQCELCLCWQHGVCNGIERESQVPEKYFCYICRNPQRGRESLKYIHDQEWLYEGKLPVASYHATSPDLEERFEILRKTHTLTGNLLELKRFMHSLKVKMNIAENKDHPKMYLWAKKWEPSSPKTELKINVEENQNKEIKNELNEDEKELEETNKSIYEQSEEKLIEKEKKDEDQEMQNKNENKDELVDSNTNQLEKEEISMETEFLNQPNIPQPEAPIDPIECQRRLLDHIKNQQSCVMQQLHDIESQVIELESLDDSNVSSNLADNVKVKELFTMYIRDLEIMKNISRINRIKPNFVTDTNNKIK